MNFTRFESLGFGVNVEFNFLKRRTQRYSILMYQHEGTLFANTTRIGNEIDASSIFSSFFQKAKDEHSDLVLTPEYSCPWKSIRNILTEKEKWPDLNKLWVVGCESIDKESLSNFAKEFTGGEYLLHFEKGVLADNKNYLDPLIYLFKVLKDNVEKLVVLIQFKTMHMGVWGRDAGLEKNNLIEGKEIYILTNSNGLSINFFSLICSEAMNFSVKLNEALKRQIEWEDKPYLIFNPQLNPEPNHHLFTSFRSFIFETPNKEIISLNWNINSKIDKSNMFKIAASRSGITLKSTEIEYNNSHRLLSNHKKGLYYFTHGKHRHSYFLNPLLHIGQIDMPAVLITEGAQEQRRRDGPELINSFIYDAHSLTFKEATNGLLDQHIQYIKDLGCLNPFFIDEGVSIIEKEILACLSSGRIPKETPFWYKVDNLFSFSMEDTIEIDQRLTYIEKLCSKSTSIINSYIESIIELDKILSDENNYPDNITDLKGKNNSIGYQNNSSENGYRFNVITDGEVGAMIIYMGLKHEWEIGEMYKKLRALFDFNNRGRIVIFYKRGNELKKIFELKAGNILKTETKEESSFKN